MNETTKHLEQTPCLHPREETWQLRNSAGRTGHNPKVKLFIIAHQDDELLTFGGGILESVFAGDAVYVICVTKGEASDVRRQLANGKSCFWHEGTHEWKIDASDFALSRDSELFDSCLALGVDNERVMMPPSRFADGTLVPWEAARQMRALLREYPGASLVTHTPCESESQHPDHQALGIAALIVAHELDVNVEFFVEPYRVEQFEREHPDVECERLEITDPAQAAMLDGARAAYSLWDPARKRFAIGYHSARTYHDQLASKPVFFRHGPGANMLDASLESWGDKRLSKVIDPLEATTKRLEVEMAIREEEETSLKAEIARLKSDAAQADKEHDALEEAVKQLETAAKKREADKAALQKEKADLLARNEQLELKIEALKASRSYRLGRALSAPYRALKRLLKRL